ncbi:MAG TPA: zinc ribbon domain-containing protein [Planctomycetota bacterium]|nr:zinc ribbon domain-containing protein [Planctomycetota bacterium]
MPVTVNCTCGKVFKVKDELAGRAVTCQVCGRTLTAPMFDAAAPVNFAPPPVPPANYYSKPPAPIAATMQCPACAEDIPANARFCPLCGEVLKDTLSQEDQTALLQDAATKLDAHLADMSAQMDDQRIKGGFLSVKSIIAGIFLLLALALLIKGITDPSPNDGPVFVVLGVIATFITGICFLVSLMNDSKASHITDAPRADIACRNFFSAVKTGRAGKAFVALIPSARTSGSAETIQFKDEKIPVNTGRYEINDLPSFRAYWKSVFVGPSMQTRAVQIKNVRVLRNIGSDMAIVQAEFAVTNYPTIAILVVFFCNLLIGVILVFALQRRENQQIKKLLIRRNGKWFIAESELKGQLDAITI